MWPRDGALCRPCARALAGQGELSRAFFRFCAQSDRARGLLPAQVQPVGNAGVELAPVDARRQAGAAHSAGRDRARCCGRCGSTSRSSAMWNSSSSLYTPLVIKPARWMLEHRDHNGLPRRAGICGRNGAAFTSSRWRRRSAPCDAAADFARDMGALDHAAEFNEAPSACGAMMRHMWVDDRKRFARMATPLGRRHVSAGHDHRRSELRRSSPSAHCRRTIPPCMAEMKAIADRLG